MFNFFRKPQKVDAPASDSFVIALAADLRELAADLYEMNFSRGAQEVEELSHAVTVNEDHLSEVGLLNLVRGEWDGGADPLCAGDLDEEAIIRLGLLVGSAEERLSAPAVASAQ